MTIQDQLEVARNEVASLRAIYDANKGKDDRKSKKLARDVAEKLEWATNKSAMLYAMTKSSQFVGQ